MVQIIVRRACEQSGCRNRKEERFTLTEAELELLLVKLRAEKRAPCFRDGKRVALNMEWRTV